MKNLKKIVALLLAAITVFSLTACGVATEGNETPDTGDTSADTPTSVTVTDHNGNKVTVPAKIDSIVVCDIYPLPSVLAVFFDSAEKLTGIAPQSMKAAKNGLLSELYPEILNAKTDFIDGTNVNIEELLTLDPDVVFYSADNTALGEQLSNAGLAAIAISASKWDYDAIVTLDNWISLLGEMFPENSRTVQVSDYSEKVLEKVTERTKNLGDSEKKRVFFLFQYSDSKITTSGKRFFGQWWADAIGAVNVGEVLDTDNSTPVNMEQIYEWDPEKIFITNFNEAQPEDICGGTGAHDWSPITAVKEGEVFKMPLGMYRSYTCGVDTPITLIWLAKATYPELFADVDITEETKNYYKEVFGIDLTDDQAGKIFAPPSEASAF